MGIKCLGVLWKRQKFKCPPLLCMLLAMTVADLGFLNHTHCILTVVSIWCERILGQYWDCGLLKCDDMQFSRLVQIFQRNLCTKRHGITSLKTVISISCTFAALQTVLSLRNIFKASGMIKKVPICHNAYESDFGMANWSL